ncbi:MAG: 16S rRNA (guanine(527)-N(7))-methyltransferase RsmG [Elusimicrobia bacterium]|nr:16S rRNA (guanine(527)-N(7))-methyltransferase RsmG [Elusimicrobiota bacterium]
MNDEVTATLASWGMILPPSSRAALETFAEGLKEKNSLLNLVSRTDEPHLWERHILDALAAVPLLRRLLPPGSVIADAGSGAGFPGLALSAALPEYRFELLDSSGKRCAFLNWSAARMKAANVSVFHRRLGERGEVSAVRYGAVLERAMGQLENILPQCLNILAEGGSFLAWQSSSQLAASRPAVDAALARAGGELLEIFSYRLPGEEADRGISVFRKRR